MKIHYQQETVALKEGETVLAALLRRGFPVRYSCRAGICHTCVMRASAGRVPQAAQQGLCASLVEGGHFLPCKCIPDEPLKIELSDASRISTSCQVIEAFALTEDTRCIRLSANQAITPLPGQHLGIVDPDGRIRRYSVANLPRQDGRLELHVRKVLRGKVSSWLVDEVKVGDQIRVLPPAGRLGDGSGGEGGRLLLVSTGTGLAPMIPIIQDALAGPRPPRIWLLHGGRTRQDLYADRWLRALAVTHPEFHYHPCCSRERSSTDCFPGRVSDWLAQHWFALGNPAVRVAGRPDMVDDVVGYCRRLSDGPDLDIRADPFHPASAASHDGSESGARRRHAPPPDPELWRRLDDGTIMREVLRDFYDLAFEDARLGPYFAGVTRQRLREKQYSYLRSLILGRRDYTGQRPRNAHHWMVISDDLFDYRRELMEQCMRAHGLTDPWVRRWHAFEDFFRSDIVKEEPSARRIGNEKVLLDGIEEAQLADGGHCDSCQRVIERGESVRFHLRLAAVYCLECSDRDTGAHPPGKALGRSG